MHLTSGTTGRPRGVWSGVLDAARVQALVVEERDLWGFSAPPRGLVITGDVNVYPAEVESVLTGCPGVEKVAVFGVADNRWGQRVVAVVVGTAGEETLRVMGGEAAGHAQAPQAVRPRGYSASPGVGQGCAVETCSHRPQRADDRLRGARLIATGRAAQRSSTRGSPWWCRPGPTTWQVPPRASGPRTACRRQRRMAS